MHPEARRDARLQLHTEKPSSKFCPPCGKPRPLHMFKGGKKHCTVCVHRGIF